MGSKMDFDKERWKTESLKIMEVATRVLSLCTCMHVCTNKKNETERGRNSLQSQMLFMFLKYRAHPLFFNIFFFR